MAGHTDVSMAVARLYLIGELRSLPGLGCTRHQWSPSVNPWHRRRVDLTGRLRVASMSVKCLLGVFS